MILHEIILQTKHLSALHDFYKNVLQLPVTRTDSKTIVIAAGKTQLIFQETGSKEDPFYHFAFNIPSGKIEEAMQWLEAKSELLWIEEYKSYIAEFTTWHARSVYFIDPAGNIVELIARFDLNDHAAGPFSSAQIRNVSEIGIVFPGAAFDEQVLKLLDDFQLQYFSKQPPMKFFRAVGNDEGLCIIVPAQRNWFPTKISSGIFSLSVKFENENREYRLQV